MDKSDYLYNRQIELLARQDEINKSIVSLNNMSPEYKDAYETLLYECRIINSEIHRIAVVEI